MHVLQMHVHMIYIMLDIITRQVTLPDGSSTILYVVLCGVKGDWPYLSISEALGPHMHVSVHGFCFLRTVRKMPFTMDRLHQPEKVPLLSIL